MTKRMLATVAALLCGGTIAADDPEFHEDYYLGFSQGAYYGLMLAGVEYHVAWCMKFELAHAGAALGAGSEFQSKLEGMLDRCRKEFGERVER